MARKAKTKARVGVKRSRKTRAKVGFLTGGLTLGNVIGGAVLLGGLYYLMREKKKEDEIKEVKKAVDEAENEPVAVTVETVKDALNDFKQGADKLIDLSGELINNQDAKNIKTVLKDSANPVLQVLNIEPPTDKPNVGQVVIIDKKDLKRLY